MDLSTIFLDKKHNDVELLKNNYNVLKNEKENIHILQSYEIRIGGMRCTNCSRNIETNVSDLDGVIKCNVSPILEVMSVTFDERKLAITNILSKIEELGFKVLQEKNLTNFILANQSKNLRNISFLFSYAQNTFPLILEFEKTVKQIKTNNYGVVRYMLQPNKEEFHINLDITYNTLIISGSEIYRKLSIIHNDIIIIDPFEITISDILSIRQNDTSIYYLYHATAAFLFVVITIGLSLYINSKQQILVNKLKPKAFPWYLIYLISISTLSMFLFGWKIIKKAIIGLKSCSYSMDTLVGMGVSISFLYGFFNVMLYVVLYQCADTFTVNDMINNFENATSNFEAGIAILNIIVIGKFIEQSSIDKVQREISKIIPNAIIEKNYKKIVERLKIKNRSFLVESRELVHINLIEQNDFIEISNSDYLLFDATVVNGEVEVVETNIYGELIPIKKNSGTIVKAGSEIVSGKAIIKIDEVIEKTLFFSLLKETRESFGKKLKKKSVFIDKILQFFVPAVILISFAVSIIWIIVGLNSVDISDPVAFAINRGISVLVASCPCALGLALPIVFMLSINKAMKEGILIKNSGTIDKLGDIKGIVFDKTGTLTNQANQAILKKHIYKKVYDEYFMWNIIYTIEKSVGHPVADFLTKESLKEIDNKILSFSVISKTYTSGGGMSAKIWLNKNENTPLFGEFSVLIGNSKLLKEAQLIEKVSYEASLPEDIIFLVINNEICMHLELNNGISIKDNVDLMIEKLNKILDNNVFVLSGDTQENVNKLGEHLKLSKNNLFGGKDAIKKKDVIAQLKTKCPNLMMVGDGLNDILSMAEADLSITINGRSELNFCTSDVVMIRDNPIDILKLIKLAKFSRIIIKANYAWAFSYNFVMIPFAAGLFCLFGISWMPSPLISSLSMASSSIIIVLTSNTIRCVNINKIDTNLKK